MACITVFVASGASTKVVGVLTTAGAPAWQATKRVASKKIKAFVKKDGFMLHLPMNTKRLFNRNPLRSCPAFTGLQRERGFNHRRFDAHKLQIAVRLHIFQRGALFRAGVPGNHIGEAGLFNDHVL